MKMTAKDVKEITYMPWVTFFSILEQPGKNRKRGCSHPHPRLYEGYDILRYTQTYPLLFAICPIINTLCTTRFGWDFTSEIIMHNCMH